ncbi:MAG: hypothetical protein AAF478_11880 [Pseudomonadota bacterium]
MTSKNYGIMFRGAAIVAMAIFAAACNPNKDVAGPPLLNGKWASSDGIYTAEFLNGSFRAIANDSGAVISEGEYIALSETQIQLKWNGLVSGRSNQADCIKQEDHQLNCVDLNGNKFSLRRNS